MKPQKELTPEEYKELAIHYRQRITKLRIVMALVIVNIAIWGYAYFQAKAFYNDYFELLVKSLSKKTGVQSALAAMPEKFEESKITYDSRRHRSVRLLTKDEKKLVLDTVEKAGLDRDEADCLLKNESSWDSEGKLVNDKGNTVDRGLWAINDYWHYEVSNDCAYDIMCSTKEAIRIRKANGNWNQWVGYVNNCK